MKQEELHAKAIRLIEGGSVQVGSHFVRLVRYKNLYDPCHDCEMDCLCHFGTDMHLVCRECDIITRDDCMLVLIG